MPSMGAGVEDQGKRQSRTVGTAASNGLHLERNSTGPQPLTLHSDNNAELSGTSGCRRWPVRSWQRASASLGQKHPAGNHCHLCWQPEQRAKTEQAWR